MFLCMLVLTWPGGLGALIPGPGGGKLENPLALLGGPLCPSECGGGIPGGPPCGPPEITCGGGGPLPDPMSGLIEGGAVDLLRACRGTKVDCEGAIRGLGADSKVGGKRGLGAVLAVFGGMRGVGVSFIKGRGLEEVTPNTSCSNLYNRG